MGLETALIGGAIASAVGAIGNTASSIYQANMQKKATEKQYRANQVAQIEANAAADEAEIARKKALVYQQESQREATKKRNTYSKQAASYQANGSSMGLGKDYGKLGG